MRLAPTGSPACLARASSRWSPTKWGHAGSTTCPGAWNGSLHAGTVTSLADTCCGYGTVRSLPAGASGFTTVELKNKLLGTVRDGIVIRAAHPVHKGRTTQVWDAEVRRGSDDAVIACFRNTPLILWPKNG